MSESRPTSRIEPEWAVALRAKLKEASRGEVQSWGFVAAFMAMIDEVIAAASEKPTQEDAFEGSGYFNAPASADLPPIPMVLYCPSCGMQHIDEAQPAKGWTNPPHRSHECQGCGCVWRPADVPTTGALKVSTHGQRDWSPVFGHAVAPNSSARSQEPVTPEMIAAGSKAIDGYYDGTKDAPFEGSVAACYRAMRAVAPNSATSAQLPADILALCKARGWNLHWTHRGAYLHLESSELIEALRGKRGDPLHEAADVLLVLMSITENAGLPWDAVLERARATCEELKTRPRYPGEEFEVRADRADATK